MLSLLVDLLELLVWLCVETWEFVYTETERVCGKIDRTPEGLYVGTEFWCFFGIALVPGRTKIYTDESTTKHFDFTIGRCWRSIVTAYLRSTLWTSTVLAGLFAIGVSLLRLLGATDPHGWVPLAWITCAVAGVGALLSMRLFARASAARADELRDILRRGVTPRGARGFEVSAGPK